MGDSLELCSGTYSLFTSLYCSLFYCTGGEHLGTISLELTFGLSEHIYSLKILLSGWEEGWEVAVSLCTMILERLLAVQMNIYIWHAWNTACFLSLPAPAGTCL